MYLVLFDFPFKRQRIDLKTHVNQVYWERNVVVVQKRCKCKFKICWLPAVYCLLVYSSAHLMLSLTFQSIMIVDKVLVFIPYLITLAICLNRAKFLVF